MPFDLKRDSDSLLAGSGLHQFDFDFVQYHDAYALAPNSLRISDILKGKVINSLSLPTAWFVQRSAS